MVGIQIGARPDSGFDDPIGMLKDCHRRIESFLLVLCLVAERARGRRLTDEESAAVSSALSYFRSGGHRHTADEEGSLFPRLRGTAAGQVVEELQRLENDHKRANRLQVSIDKLFTAWLESGGLSASDEQMLLQETVEVDRIYKAHIKIEEEVVFQEASRVLDKQTIQTMGQEFRTRRT